MNLPDEKLGCHRTGFAKKCRKLVTSGVCNRWVHVTGADPVTGEALNKFNCIDNWEFTFMLELGRQQHGVSASLNSFRNEVVALNQLNPVLQLLEDQKSSEPKRITEK